LAALKGDGSLVTWGDPDHGGGSSAVQANEEDVVNIGVRLISGSSAVLSVNKTQSISGLIAKARIAFHSYYYYYYYYY
jgi:hypothetical protein